MKRKSIARKLTALIMALSLVMALSGMTALAASAATKLSDGDYTVKVQLWHSSKDQASMAASCLKEDADLTVKNGKKTMTVYTQPMTMAGITATMQTMSVKQADGTYKDAKVAEKDANGDPTAFTFDVPADDDEYIDVQVNPELEILNNSPMDARIKVDYSGTSAEKTPDTTSSATKQAEEPTTEAEAPATVADPVKNLTNALTNKNDFADGTYTVPVKLWHSEKDQASMAASSLKPSAKLVVNSGNATMYIYTQPMTMGSITASLQEMKVQQTDGSWVDAEVASRSSDGMPNSFKFKLPAKEEYIPVQVNPHVEMMGNQFLDARIKVDWSGLKESSDTTTVDPNGASVTTVIDSIPTGSETAAVSQDGTLASGVDTGDKTDGSMMVWYAIAVGALTFAVCFAVLKRGLV